MKNGRSRAVLEALYQRTPLEDSFSINARWRSWMASRTWASKRCCGLPGSSPGHHHAPRCFRLTKCEDRLLVEGLPIAIPGIDDVIAIIRSSDDAEARVSAS